jgi:EAL domain-containing protein (putative c-di-GMP-specific phosphodiesterase class I)
MSQTFTKPSDRDEELPKKPEGWGRLFLWVSRGRGFGKLVQWLGASGCAHEVLLEGQCVGVRLEGERLGTFVADLMGGLTREEVRAVRALFVVGEGEPQLADFPRVSSLAQLLTLSRAGWLVDMLAERRITTHYQPIVHARDTQRVFAYEALMRGMEPDGALVSPGRMLALAREAELLSQLDLEARLSAVREACRLGLRLPLFINFSPAAIAEPASSLRSTMEAIDELGLGRENVVFELIESDHTAEAGHLRSILTFCRQAGVRVALDDLGAGYSSLNLIHQLRPDIMKLDMELIRGIHEDPYKASITQKLLELARELGIQTVAEGIESQGELRWVREHGVDFVQGYLIARPQSPPVSVLPAFSE